MKKWIFFLFFVLGCESKEFQCVSDSHAETVKMPQIAVVLGSVGSDAIVYRFDDENTRCYVAVRNSITMQNSPSIWCGPKQH
jgi:hypothetical protein